MSVERPGERRTGPRAGRTGRPAGFEPLVLALVVGLAAGCGDGTAPEAGPERIARLSAVVDSVSVGDTLDSPLRVRVESAGGGPVSGAEVRFRIVGGGPGRVEPAAAATGTDGTAAARFVAGDRVGSSSVRADLPAHPSLAPVHFTVRTVVPTRTRLIRLSGDDQRAERNSQLARPFVVRVTTRDSVPAGGVPVHWSVSSAAGPGAHLTADTVFSGPEGRARSLLTLGEERGTYAVTARSPGADSAVTFSATAVDSIGSGVRLDSVSPRPLRAGEPATLYGSGFGTAGRSRVWVEGEEARVTSAATGRLRVRVPTFEERCLPARTVGVRVVEDGRQSNGRVARLRPAVPPLALAPGESRIVREPDRLRCLRFGADTTGRHVRIAVQSASRSGGVTPVRVVGRSGADVGAGREAAELAADRTGRAARTGRIPGRTFGASRAELRVRLGARAALRRSGARPADVGSGTAGRGPRVSVRSQPSVTPGDRRTFLLSVRPDGLRIDCRDTTAVVNAVARAVGEHVVLYEDPASPRRGLTDADFRRLRDEFDEAVFPVDTAYFGPPADIDSNGRIAVLFTPEVNELNAPAGETFVGGFFLPTDLAESGDDGGGASDAGGVCPVSNEGEVIYLAVPDPLGAFGRTVDRGRALRNARSVTAHELQHLISAERRVFRTPVGEGENPFDDLESAWLSEGMSHLAEEVVGLELAGLEERARLGFDEAARETEVFNAFHINNFGRARLYLRNPAEAPVLSGEDPGGDLSLEMRGFGWLFARFLGDQVGPAGSSSPLGGSAEHRLFRRLSRGGGERATGVDNVLRAAAVGEGARTWEGLLGDFGIAVAAGDSAELRPDRRFRTWRLGDVYAGLHRNLPSDFREGYPLRPEQLDFASTALAFDLGSSTAAYVGLRADSASAAYSLRVVSPGGGSLPPSARAQVLVLRLR